MLRLGTQLNAMPTSLKLSRIWLNGVSNLQQRLAIIPLFDLQFTSRMYCSSIMSIKLCSIQLDDKMSGL